MISRLEIQNFKSLKNFGLNFKKLTVLAGSNSVGKSSVIQSLLLTRITIEKLQQYNMLDHEFNKSKRTQIPLNGKYELNLGNTLEVLSRDVNSNIISINIFEKSKSIFINLIAEDNNEYTYDLELDYYDIRPDYEVFKNEFYYLNAERIGPRLSYDVEQLDFNNVGHKGEYTIQIIAQNKEESIENPDTLKFEGVYDLKLITQLRAWMDYIIPGFYLDLAELEGKLKKAYTTFSKSSPTNVGFGISYVLPIVVNGLLAKKGSVFIVENPEAHLHPKGQSNIGYFLGNLANSGIQVIVETHSEHVINGMRRASFKNKEFNHSDLVINFFHGLDDEKNSLVKEISLQESGDLESFPKDFFDQVQQDMLSIFKFQRDQNG